MRTLLYTVFALLMTTTMGCVGRIVPPAAQPEPLPHSQGTVEAETYHTIEELLQGDSIQIWPTLSETAQQHVWEALVDDVPYPLGAVRLQQMSHLDNRPRSQTTVGTATEQVPEVRNVAAAGTAWLPATPTLAAAVATESQVGPLLPERIHNIVEGEGSVGSQELSRALGFNITETYAPPQVNPQPIPPNTQVALVPVVLYHASTFELWNNPRLGNAQQIGTGRGYEYAGIALFSFVIEP